MEHPSEVEQRIFRAATEVFLEKGKAGARLQAIADKAGINKALLHYYFRSKDRLYAEVFRREFSGFIDGFFASITESDDIRDYLRLFIHKYIDGVSRRPELIRFFSWDIQEGGEILGTTLREKLASREGLPSFPANMLRQAVRTGAIRPVDPVQFTISLIGMCLYPFIARPILERIFPGLQILSADFLNARKTEIFNLLWDGIRPAVKEN